MTTFRTGTVTEILQQRNGLTRVRLSGLPHGDRAYALTQLTGPVAVGDRLVVNTTAVELGLGTGGWHVVHWNLSRESLEVPGPDHIMKVRYTSIQQDVGTDELRHPDLPSRIDDTVVVGCFVHSQMATVAATIHHLDPSLRVSYVMTDGAALPIALSDLVAQLSDRNILHGTVTAGHAFGGELEAVSVPSALALAAHVQQADVIVVSMGPGIVGTGSALGTTGVEVASILDLAAAMGGSPVLCARASSGDPRPRHQGLSHHTRTVLSLMHSTPWVAPIPEELTEHSGVRLCHVDPVDPIAVLEAADLHVTTMGRTPPRDLLYFQAAAAAGAVAVKLSTGI